MRAATRRIAAEIRRYCRTHPNACDTLEGIAWWITLQRYEETRQALADAVQLLVREGRLQRHDVRDGSEVFGCIRPMRRNNRSRKAR